MRGSRRGPRRRRRALAAAAALRRTRRGSSPSSSAAPPTAHDAGRCRAGRGAAGAACSAIWIATRRTRSPCRAAAASASTTPKTAACSASVKLQELFGLADTPRIGPRREPVQLALLAPNGRPVQITRDLRSFWDRTYPEVRKELRGRYPKHPWPEDPWTAPPTARAKRKV